MPRLQTHLWFETQAEEAVAFYTAIFPNSRILRRIDLPEPELSRIEFELDGHPVVALNARDHEPYNESVSLLVETETQEETDRYWNALTADGGKEQPCGWLIDKFGIYWQVTPRLLLDMEADSDRKKAGRVMQAMFEMKKIVIADLESAFCGED